MGHGLDDWVIVDQKFVLPVTATTWVPRGQTKEIWQEMVTIGTATGLPLDQKAEELLDANEKVTVRCDNYRRSEPRIEQQNNYAVATSSFLCDRSSQSGQGGIGVVKVVITNPGRSRIVQRLARVPPFDIAAPPAAVSRKQQELIKWINGVMFCNKGDPKHPCPPGT